jgi:hypothetical protein
MHNAGEPEALLVENPATTLQPESPRQAELPPERHEPQQEALPVEKPAADLPDDGKPTMTGNEPMKVPDFSSAAGNVWAYQAKLLEMAQANMQFAFEFPQRLATIRSPGEFFSVIAEFTDKRIVMSQKYSREIAEFSALR